VQRQQEHPRCGERERADRQIGFRQQGLPPDLLRPDGHCVPQRGPRSAKLGLREIAQRLLAVAQHVGAQQVDEMIVVEAAESAAKRIEAEDERRGGDDGGGQQRSGDTPPLGRRTPGEGGRPRHRLLS
jgi:hypothetical protein